MALGYIFLTTDFLAVFPIPFRVLLSRVPLLISLLSDPLPMLLPHGLGPQAIFPQI